MFSAPDRAIWINRFAVNGISNPEGYLWSLLNPWELGPFKYKVWCFTFDMVMLTAQLRTRKIPIWYLAFHQVFSIYFYTGWGHTFQNITIVSIMPFMYLVPWIGLLAILQKLPIWFDWNNLKNHILCALYCTPVHNEGNISTYVGLIFLFIMPLMVRRIIKEKPQLCLI